MSSAQMAVLSSGTGFYNQKYQQMAERINQDIADVASSSNQVGQSAMKKPQLNANPHNDVSKYVKVSVYDPQQDQKAGKTGSDYANFDLEGEHGAHFRNRPFSSENKYGHVQSRLHPN